MMTKPAIDLELTSSVALTSRRADLAAFLAVVLFSWVLAFLPHFLWWVRIGEPVYIADYDDVEYMSFCAPAYFNHPGWLSDPTVPETTRSPYPAIQFVPAIATARLLNLGPQGVDLVWRTWAGVSLGATFFLVIRRFVSRPWLAALLAATLLADVGVMSANPFWGQARTLLRAVSGRGGELFQGAPQLLTQYRIITPGLSLWALLLHVWFVARARERPTWPRILAAAASCGLLFYVYFYFWTAAGLALFTALALDRGHRRVFFFIGLIGLLLGLPSIISNYLMTRDYPKDWMLRSDMFLPIPRFSEILIPRVGVALAVVALAWTLLRRHDLLYLACMLAAGLLLLNHQVITGLQIQNFHWTYVWGPCGSLLIVFLGLQALQRPLDRLPALRLLLAAACLSSIAAGTWLRVEEGRRSAETRDLMANYVRYRDQRLEPSAPSIPPGTVVAGDPAYTEMAIGLENLRPLAQYCTLFSPTVVDAEFAERQALNAALGGTARETFKAQQTRELGLGWGPWSRNPALLSQRLEELLANYDRSLAAADPALDRFHVGLVARKDDPPPPGTGWQLVQAGPTWKVWQRGQASATH